MEITSPNKALCRYKEAWHKETPKDVLHHYYQWIMEDIYVSGVGVDGKLYFWKGAKRGTRYYINKIHKKISKGIRAWLYNHSDLNYWKFITLTVPETDIESLQVFRKRWNSFLTNLRQKFPKMRIFRVYELQKRGSVHLHAIIWGIKWIPTDWLNRNWSYGRPEVQRPRSISGIFFYLTKYLTKAFAYPYVQAFMWFWRIRQWASNFPCPDQETNSKSKLRIFGIGVCVLKQLSYLSSRFTVSLETFLRSNGLLVTQIRWIWENFSRDEAYEHIAGILKYNWKQWRHEGLFV